MAHRHHNHHHQAVVTSGESDHEEESLFHIQSHTDDDSDIEAVDEPAASRKRSLETVEENANQEEWERSEWLNPDLLYDASADERDEAFVNQHYRRHSQQSEQSASASTNNNETRNNTTDSNTTASATHSSQSAVSKPLKPPNSDAVLSCPCCFATVCMNCQQHERFPNQYRAMFVMNVSVSWEDRLVYSPKDRKLVEFHEGNPKSQTTPDGKPIYYRVCCASCQTHVASLDMTDEVYHFYGCLSSS